MGLSLGASLSQIAASIANIEEVDNKRTLIMLSKKLDYKEKIIKSTQNDLSDNDQHFSQEIAPIRQTKKI
jgi:hypothetical protein